jgi:hypothetical protein
MQVRDHATVSSFEDAGARIGPLNLTRDDATEARAFKDELGAAADFLASYETTAPIVAFDFRDGRGGTLSDIWDVSDGLLALLLSYFDLPHVGWLEVDLSVHDRARRTVQLSFEGHDGPLIVRFSDSSMLLADQLPTQSPEATIDRWDVATRTGVAQQTIESVVTLAELVGLADALDGNDRRVVHALLAMLAELSTIDSPPKGPVRSALRWTLAKVDLLLDEAAKTAGKALGIAAVGAGVLVAKEHFPALEHALRGAYQLADNH